MGGGPILLVGFQRGVLPALRRIDRPAYILAQYGLPLDLSSEIEGIAYVDLQGAVDDIAEAAASLLDGLVPAAIVALAERTVVVAAALREAYALGGNLHAVALACADKREMKATARAAHVPTAPWCDVDTASDPDALLERLGLPMVLKPRRDSGGRGQCVVRRAKELPRALAGLGSTTHGWIAESWIDGTEMSIECFVEDGEVVWLSTTEYFVPRHANIVPAEIDGATLGAIDAFVRQTLKGLGVRRGITHMEIFRTASGLVFGELAIRPPGGRLMTLIQRAFGFSPWEALVRLELGEHLELRSTPRCCSGVWILHPGVGRVRSIEGIEAARSLPGIRRIALKIDVGDVVSERIGSGQDVGAIYAEAESRGAVADALRLAHEVLRIELDPPSP